MASKLEIVHRETLPLGSSAQRDAFHARLRELKDSGKYAKVTSRRLSTYSFDHSILCYAERTASAKVQYRGTCQVCGAAFSVGYKADSPKAVAFHGYTRTGNGYTIGECWGRNAAPAERDISVALHSIERLRSNAARDKAEAERLTAEHGITEHALTCGGAWARRATKWEDYTPLQKVNYLRRQVQGALEAATFIERHVVTRLGQPLYQKEV